MFSSPVCPLRFGPCDGGVGGYGGGGGGGGDQISLLEIFCFRE